MLGLSVGPSAFRSALEVTRMRATGARAVSGRIALASYGVLIAVACSGKPATVGTGSASSSAGSSSTGHPTGSGGASTTGNESSSGVGGGTSVGTSAGTTTGSSGGSTTSGGSTSGGGVLTLGSPCSPAAIPDPCVVYGYSCAQGGTPDGSTCQVPGNLQQCLSSVGCLDGLACTLVFRTLVGSDAGISYCIGVSCDTTGGCPAADMKCSGSTCTTNSCGPIVTGSTYYGTCDASDAGDGECLPFQMPDHTITGRCYQTGAASIGTQCFPVRDDAGELCAQGAFCVTGQATAICMMVCDATGNLGGPATCPSNGTCISGLTEIGPSYQEWGVCLTYCYANPCPTGQICTQLPSASIPPVCLPR
jgi:hypothetical protein